MATPQQQGQAFIRLLDSKDFKYDVEDGGALVILPFGGGSWSFESIRVFVRFSEDGTNVHFTGYPIVRAAGDKLANMLLVCNKANKDYRWVKFYVDDEGDVIADADAVVDDITVADECFEVSGRLITIIDEVYPEFMKAQWG